MASIRILLISLVVICIVVVAVLCTSLAVWSGDRALDDTKENREESMNSAFGAGERNVIKVTTDYLNSVGDSSVAQLASFWQVSHDAVKGICWQMIAENKTTLHDYRYIHSFAGQLLQTVKAFNSIEGIGIVSTNDVCLQYFETRLTTQNPASGFHHYLAIMNNGSNFDTPGNPSSNRTVIVDVINERGDVYDYPPQGVSPLYLETCTGLGQAAVGSNGAQYERACRSSGYNLQARHFREGYRNFPKGVPIFTPLSALGTYVGAAAQCMLGDRVTGELHAMVYGGSNMEKITLFLSSLDLGQSRNSLGRVFATVRGDIVMMMMGYLAGTSHGSSVAEISLGSGDGETTRRPILATECSDPLVSSAATFLGQEFAYNATLNISRYEAVYRKADPQMIPLPSPRSPRGELFYMSVKLLDNGLGINWYITTLIDREYVLGEVDRTTISTKQSVKESEDTVNGDLENARIVLYIVVVGVAILPIVLTVLLVLKITEPLMLLMRDMSYVAVMSLEHVDADRPLSKLSELNQMESSFKLMLNNLVEYRQYLPQSVLCDTEEEHHSSAADHIEGLTSSRLDSHSKSRSECSMSKSMSIIGNRGNLFDTQLKQKNVTVFVSNLCGFLDKSDVPLLGKADLLTRYLEPVVASAKLNRGVIDDFSGDRIAASFNTSLPASSHRVNAVIFTTTVSKAWDQSQNIAISSANCAISTGSALCGNTGCTGLKKYSIIGGVACNARMLERCGRAWGVARICDSSIASDVQDRYSLRKLVRVSLKHAKPTILSEIVEEKQVTDNEWMYQIEEGQAKDKYTPVNEAVGLLYKGDFASAQAKLSAGVPGADLVRQLLEEAIRTGNIPDNVDIYAIPRAVAKCE